MCNADPVNSNVKVLNPGSEYMWGEEVWYTCSHGYVLIGPESRKCTQQHGITRWTGFNPSCQREFLCGMQCDTVQSIFHFKSTFITHLLYNMRENNFNQSYAPIFGLNVFAGTEGY